MLLCRIFSNIFSLGALVVTLAMLRLLTNCRIVTITTRPVKFLVSSVILEAFYICF